MLALILLLLTYACITLAASSGASDDEGPWHVYICDVLSMRQLLPLLPCWKKGLASFLISLLQQKSAAEHHVVVLKALCEAPGLEGYYERIGFTAGSPPPFWRSDAPSLAPTAVPM